MGGVPTGGGFPDLDLAFLFVLFLSFLGLSRFFRILQICPGTLRGFSRFVLFLFLGLLTAPTRNSPERVRDTIWTFPEKKMANPPVWKPPGLASLKYGAIGCLTWKTKSDMGGCSACATKRALIPTFSQQP